MKPYGLQETPLLLSALLTSGCQDKLAEMLHGPVAMSTGSLH